MNKGFKEEIVEYIKTYIKTNKKQWEEENKICKVCRKDIVEHTEEELFHCFNRASIELQGIDLTS